MQVQYKPRRNWLQTLLQTEIAQGLALTLRHMFRKPVTQQYPDEKPVVAAGFRGRHALVRDAESGGSRCVACMRCARVCPSHCIRIRSHRSVDGSRKVNAYVIDALRCIYCGYCAEVCPVNAIVLTEIYAYAGRTRQEFVFDEAHLLRNWDEFAAEKGSLEGYVNPLSRPRNALQRFLPAPKRKEHVSAEWSGEEQWVGQHWQAGKLRNETAHGIANMWESAAPGLAKAPADTAE
ncbi:MULTISPECIES: NADH-quinone oxidoreductase subunit NuoI [Desulfovibrio]|uniref:NADH-quinone oxidoreductase subunit I n=1 Tax=Desulfovibrio desulfuricans TaxID=876 RepID=A0AA94L323_DESDE|nr:MULTISPECIES: NADH-quinone oxidoreductase subunit NuoI [Desulfovibrio]ATD80768.1 NADH-quinone oxidoreductase subunit NuoI [Desulfovibrio sp. G11]SFW64798.1 NADH-quinone oxidoreductase subunit I [Desulfovibrio desulfuricans]SPD36307.1 NADH:ubiquinone reductase (H+-translocating)/NADH dehydrogenase (quinone), subunit I [Desulfovibrio sp. G11]